VEGRSVEGDPVEGDPVEENPVEENPVEQDPWVVEEDPVEEDPATKTTEDDHANLHQCAICFGYEPAEGIWEAPCEHLYCSNCLGRLVSNWYPATRPPMCCGQAFLWDDLKAGISEELAATVDNKREELESRDRTYCPEPTCSAFIGADHIDTATATATCPTCGKAVCTECKAASHSGECVTVTDESEIEVLAQACTEGWQTCRNCQMLVVREGGCPHME